MLKSSLLAFTLVLAGSAAAQTTTAPATTPAPAEPAAAAATTGASAAQSLRRCSAEIRDRCLQDERFARDVARPGGGRDNNAMAYPTSSDAERGRPR